MIKFSFLLLKKKVFYTIYIKKGRRTFKKFPPLFIVTYVFLYKIEL